MIFKCQLGGACPNEATIFYEVYGINYDSTSFADRFVFAYVIKRCEHCDRHGQSNMMLKEISLEEAICHEVMGS